MPIGMLLVLIPAAAVAVFRAVAAVFLQINQYRAEGGDERRSVWVGLPFVAFYPLAKALQSNK